MERNKWIHITQDNVDALYECTDYPHNVVIHNKKLNMTRIADDWPPSLATMSRIGGFYAYIISDFNTR